MAFHFPDRVTVTLQIPTMRRIVYFSLFLGFGLWLRIYVVVSLHISHQTAFIDRDFFDGAFGF
jgi:hypothetical protein